jgi:acyl-CoA synthetase (AMP-forming)/AMP-acid ligase II
MPRARVAGVYGSTEAEPIADIARSEISVEDEKQMFAGAGLLAGHPVADIDLRIAPDQWGRPLPPVTCSEFDRLCLGAGKHGEIVVHGAHVLSGYLNGVGDEQAKWHVDNEIWHRTGDAGYLDDRGRLWLLGRAEAKIQDEQRTIYPFAVECAASRIEGVRRSALVQHNEQRVLVVQRTTSPSPDLETILLRELAWAGIHKIHFLPQVPLDKRHNAKIDYPELRAILARTLP